MAARRRCHHAEAPRPTWIVIKAAPPAPAKKPDPPAYSPVLPSPAVWQNAQMGGVDGSGVPASPRIGCMGQVKGGRRCSTAHRVAAKGKGSGFCLRSLAGLLSGFFGRRRRVYSKVRDVASDSSSSSGSSRGTRAARLFDQPLPVPVVRRPTMEEEKAPSLWERRRGGGKALEGLQLT